MGKDRIIGAAVTVKGIVKQVFGTSIGDAKMVSAGQSDRIAGKTQNAMGGIKDALRRK